MAQKIEAAEAVKHFAKAGITVRVPTLDKKGEEVRDPETKKFVTEVQKLAAEHIHSARDEGDEIAITTVDGQKYRAPKLKEGK